MNMMFFKSDEQIAENSDKINELIKQYKNNKFISDALRKLKKSNDDGFIDYGIEEILDQNAFNVSLMCDLYANKLITLDMILDKAIESPNEGIDNIYNFIADNLSLSNQARADYMDSYYAYKHEPPFLSAKTCDINFYMYELFGKNDLDANLQNEVFLCNKSLEILRKSNFMKDIFCKDWTHKGTVFNFENVLKWIKNPSLRAYFLSETLDILKKWQPQDGEVYGTLSATKAKKEAIELIKAEIFKLPSLVLSDEELAGENGWQNLADWLKNIPDDNIKRQFLIEFNDELKEYMKDYIKQISNRNNANAGAAEQPADLNEKKPEPQFGPNFIVM
ncbi:MAG: hypothetical protein LBM38_01295 [Clostridiales bacterium]|jgi:hypothetical protein|nr:hypothetical protein [Clostridiales bacterium]